MDLYSHLGRSAIPVAPIINGRELAHRLRLLSPAKRALLAHDLQHGSLYNLTRPQAAAVARVSISYVASLRHISADERERLQCGAITLSALHNKYRRPLSDADVERVVKRIGVGRVFAVIDKLTAPMMQAAE
jgi:hypothetical protein